MKATSVLHVIASMDPNLGGVCKAVRVMIRGLDDLTVDNEVVCLDAPGAAYLMFDQFPIHALGPGKGPWCYSKKLIPWLVNNFSRFDTVILHGLWLYNGYAVNKALRLYNTRHLFTTINSKTTPKLFVMPHGMLDPYFQKASDRKLKALRNWAYWKLIENQIVNKSDGVLFTCEEEKQLASKPFRPYTPKREFVIGLGIEDPPCYSRKIRDAFLEKCPELENHSYILFLGRIHPKKGVDLLINAYYVLYNKAKAQLVSDMDNSVLHKQPKLPKLVIAGPNLESSYGQGIQKLAHQSADMKNRIHFPGMLSGDAKWGALYGCEAFVLPSHQENFGIAVVEALACKKPVLISNEINIWKEIKNSGAGVINEDTLEGTIELLNCWTILSQLQKEMMGKHAGEAFEKYFAIAPFSKRTKDVLNFSLV